VVKVCVQNTAEEPFDTWVTVTQRPNGKNNETFFKQQNVAMAVDGQIFNEKDLIVTKLSILKPAEPWFRSKNCWKQRLDFEKMLRNEFSSKINAT